MQEVISEKSKERYNGWWQHELIDRALVQVCTPRKEKNNYFKINRDNLYSSVAKRWKNKGFDNDYLIDAMKEVLSSEYFAGDAFPVFHLNFGPGSPASFVGCILEFREDTVWIHPFKDNEWKNLNNIEIDPNNKYWQIAKDLAKKASERNHNNYFINASELFSGLDIIASLRGAQQLLFDLIESPKEVKKLNKFMTRAFKHYYDGLYNIISTKQEGLIGWLPVWCDKRSITLQCDFSAMISSQMFEEFEVPELISCAKHFDNVIYHLDGPDAVRHLDIILDIKEIDAIEWTPGTGSPPTSKWIPMLKKIQKKKKSMYLYADDLGEVEKLLTELEPEGLLINKIDADLEEEADYVVKRVEDLTIEKLKRRNTAVL